jgi:hypothetical protein
MTRLVVLLSLAFALALVGCSKEEPKAEPPKAEAPKPAEPAPAAPAAEAPKPAEAAPAEAPASPVVPSEELKAKLSAAYADIYCAQIAGKPEAVMEAYKRHGYENLEDWSRGWRLAAKDVEWVKGVMTDAKNACPK